MRRRYSRTDRRQVRSIVRESAPGGEMPADEYAWRTSEWPEKSVELDGGSSYTTTSYESSLESFHNGLVGDSRQRVLKNIAGFREYLSDLHDDSVGLREP